MPLAWLASSQPPLARARAPRAPTSAVRSRSERSESERRLAPLRLHPPPLHSRRV